MDILQKLKRFLPVFLIVVVTLLLILVFSLPAILGTEFVQTQIRQQISKLFPAGLTIGEINLDYFPLPHLQISGLDVTHKISASDNVSVSATSIEVYPDLFKILFKQIALSQVYTKGGEVRYRFRMPHAEAASEIPLEDIRLSAKDVRGPRRLDAKLDGRFFSAEKNLKFHLSYDATRDPFWVKESLLNAEISLKDLELQKVQSALLPNAQLYVTGGSLDLDVKAFKSRKDERVSIELKFELKNVSYKEFGSEQETKIEWLKGDGQADYDVAVKMLNIRDFNIESSLGDAVVRGKLDLAKDFKTEGIDIEISLPEIKLDQWAVLLPAGVTEKVQLGGEARLNVLLRGGWDKLSAKIGSNFTEAAIQIPDMFEKPKGKALEVSGQFNLENRSRITGEFELRFLEAVAKGTILQFIPATSDYEVTFLTNKFSVAELPEAVVPLKPYLMSGSVKWLLNIKGNAAKKSYEYFRTHFDAEDVSLSGAFGPIVSQLGGALDYQQNDLVINNFRCMLGGKPLLGSLKVVGPMPASFTFVLQPSEGMIQGKGVVENMAGEYVATSEISAQNVPLGQVLPPLMQGKNYIEGSASTESIVKVRGRDTNEMLQSLHAQGKLQIVNGKFNTIDIMAAFGGIKNLVALAAESHGFTQFLSAETEYEAVGTTVYVKNGYLRSERFDAEFSGQIAPEEIDIELNVLLSYALSKRIVPSLGVDQVLRLPARISGPPEEPQISVARSVLDAAFGSLINNFTQGIFGRSVIDNRKAEGLIVQRNPPSVDPNADPAAIPSPSPQAEDQATTEEDTTKSTPEEELVQTGVQLFSDLFGNKRS